MRKEKHLKYTYYIDETTIIDFTNNLIEAIKHAKSNRLLAIATYEGIPHQSCTNTTRNGLISTVEKTRDTLLNQMRQAQYLIEKIGYILRYHRRHHITTANTLLHDIQINLTALYDQKSILLNNPAKPIQFHQLTTISETYDLFLTAIDQLIIKAKSCHNIETMLLFAMEGSSSNSHSINIRNMLRHALLQYIRQGISVNHTAIKTALENINHATTTNDALTTLPTHIGTKKHFFQRTDSLHTIIKHSLVGYTNSFPDLAQYG